VEEGVPLIAGRTARTKRSYIAAAVGVVAWTAVVAGIAVGVTSRHSSSSGSAQVDNVRPAVFYDEVHCFMSIGTAHQQTSDDCRPHLLEYVKEFAYQQDVAKSMSEAVLYFKDRQASANCTDLIVLDIDETCISNLEVITKDDFLYNNTDWNAYANSGNAPALLPTLELYAMLFNKGFSLALITGRPDTLQAATAENLRRAGFGVPCGSAQTCSGDQLCYQSLTLRGPSDMGVDASIYKPLKREMITKQGYNIVGLVGDQWSDLSGEFGPKDDQGYFKLPNPFYYIK